MKTRSHLAAAAAALLFLTCPSAPAGLLNKITLNINVLPNTPIEVTTQLSITGVEDLLASLTGAEASPIQIVDGVGNVIGEIPVADLIESLTGLTGDVVKDVTVVLDSGVTGLTEVVSNVVDSPGDTTWSTTVEVTHLTVLPRARTVAAVLPANLRPLLKLTGKQIKGGRLILRGTASDDAGVARVEVVTGGKWRNAAGTGRWSVRAALHSGSNRVAIRAIDTAGMASKTRHLKIVVKP